MHDIACTSYHPSFNFNALDMNLNGLCYKAFIWVYHQAVQCAYTTSQGNSCSHYFCAWLYHIDVLQVEGRIQCVVNCDKNSKSTISDIASDIV